MENQEDDKIKSKLPHNSYFILSEILKGKYKPRTIEAMFRGVRTMKPEVLEAAKSFLKLINIEL